MELRFDIESYTQKISVNAVKNNKGLYDAEEIKCNLIRKITGNKNVL